MLTTSDTLPKLQILSARNHKEMTMSGQAVLKGGAGEADVTPELGIQIAGDIGRRRPVDEIRERIYARALVLESGATRCCFLSIEVCYITDKWVHQIRKRASEKFNLPYESIMVHAQQNHSAPAVGNAAVSDEYKGLGPDLWWLRSGDERYNEPFVAGVLTAIGAAVAKLTPVTVHGGREIDGRTAFNRRFVMRDGTAIAHPPRNGIRYVEGPVDPEVAVVVLRDAKGANVAALLHYTCHPVHGYPLKYIMGDWPGAWASAMRGALGGDCVPLVVNGCCGNIHHQNHLDPTHTNYHIRMAGILADSASKALQQLEALPFTELKVRTKKVRLPMRDIAPEKLAAAKKLLADKPNPPMLNEALPSIEWDWVYAHTLVDLAERRERQPYYDYEVQTFGFGGVGMVALTGEPFVEAQLKIKEESPFAFTLAAHMANGYAGYIPTPHAIEKGGEVSFETRTCAWCQFTPDALDNITGEAVVGLKAVK